MKYFLLIFIIMIVLIYIIADKMSKSAILRKDNSKRDNSLPTYVKSDTENAVISQNKAKISTWNDNFPPKIVQIKSFDKLNLWAKFYQNVGDLFVICLHGYNGTHKSLQDVAMYYFEQGYSVLTPDLRSHGKSDGKYITFGYFESRDVIFWCNFILQRNPNAKIVLHGESMGGATVMMTAGRQDLPKNVIAIIEDSGYSDAFNTVYEQMSRQYKVPKIPFMNFGNLGIMFNGKFSLRKVRPIISLKKSKLPILFIHGSKDNFVKPYMQDQLFKSYTGKKQKLTVEGAYHVASRNVAKELYYSTIFNFLDNIQENL